MREELGTPGAVVGSVVLAFLFGGLTLSIYPGWAAVAAYLPQAPGWQDLIGGASAVGTCAAVVVALAISSKQGRETELRRTEAAQLAAAGIVATLESAIQYANSAAPSLFAESEDQIERELGKSRRHLARTFPRPDQQALLALTPLGGHCAQRIARAFDQIDGVRHSAAGLSEEMLTARGRGSRRRKNELLTDWSDSLQQVEDLLRTASAVCVRAADIGAPYPTGQELYGDWEESDF